MFPQIHMPELPDKPPLVVDGKEKFLEIAEVNAGDVLMSASTIEGSAYGYISWLVRKLDQDWYSHTAFFDGETVFECGLSGGVLTNTLPEVIKRNRYTDVYRYETDACRTEGRTSANCRLIGSDGYPVQPLKKVAREYVKTPYATHEAVLAGLLMLRKRKLTTSIIGGLALRAALNVAIAWCREKKPVSGKAALTCSELVYRIFDEAEPEKKYRLIVSTRPDADAPFYVGQLQVKVADPTFDIPVEEILSSSSLGHAAAAEQEFKLPREFVDIAEELREFAALHREIARPGPSLPATWADLAEAKSAIVLSHDANMISPADISHSGNLREVGRLRKN